MCARVAECRRKLLYDSRIVPRAVNAALIETYRIDASPLRTDHFFLIAFLSTQAAILKSAQFARTPKHRLLLSFFRRDA